jgi:hypothetical protein
MSIDLLEPEAININRPYLQTPVDDLWSFYYVGQWAAAYSSKFLDPEKLSELLLRLRNNLAGSLYQRGHATGTVTDSEVQLLASDYGTFLVESQSLLAPWYSKLKRLSANWTNKMRSFTPAPEDRYKEYYPLFKEYTRKGVVEYLRLLVEEYDRLE